MQPAFNLDRFQFTEHPLRFSEVRIENTNRCGYRCFFCPREEMTREQGFMPLDDLSLVLERVGEHEGLVDLHGFGEPMLDRSLRDKIAMVKARWPKAEPRFYSTLGVKAPKGYFAGLVEAGLRHVEVSFYGFDAKSYQQAHGSYSYEIARENLGRLARQQHLAAGGLKVVVRAFPRHDTVKQPGATETRMADFHQWLDGLGIAVFRERDLHNYGDGRAYNVPGANVPCSVVWGFRRRVLQVTWNLHVIPCCFDSNATVRFGNLRTQSLGEIFSGPIYREFIQRHIDNRLEAYPVCHQCERCYQE
jgi:Iron-sulfur cluster-binding domain/Radical SAM superfamily